MELLMKLSSTNANTLLTYDKDGVYTLSHLKTLVY